MTRRIKTAIYFTPDERLALADHAARHSQSFSDLVRKYAMNWLNMLEQNDVSLSLSPKRGAKPFTLVEPEDGKI